MDKVLGEVLGGARDTYLEAVVELTLLLTPSGRKRIVSGNFLKRKKIFVFMVVEDDSGTRWVEFR